MPITMHIDVGRRRVVARVEGDFTLEEIFDALDRCLEDPRFQPGFAILSDHTAVGEPLTPEQARAMAARLERLAELVAGCRWAVVTSRPASHGMIRMLSALVESVPLEVGVFASHEEAEAWLSAREPHEL